MAVKTGGVEATDRFIAACPSLSKKRSPVDHSTTYERVAAEHAAARPPGGSVRSAALLKQVRIVLTPLAVPAEERAGRRAPKRSRAQPCRPGGSSEEQAGGQAACGGVPGPREPEASSRPAELAVPEASPGMPASAAGRPENGGAKASACCFENDSTELSAYEKKRLKNITENAEYFASLKLFESAARLREMTIKGQSHEIKRVKPSKTEAETACRRSMRLQRVDPLGIPLPEKPAEPELSVEEHQCLPPGPIQMIPAHQDQRTEPTEGVLNTWAKISQVEPKNTKKNMCNLESYKARLCGMVLREDCVAKVVKSRIYSVAIHPSESRTLVAAGDNWGHVGLWDLDCKLEDGIHAFTLHRQPVSCLQFAPFNAAQLLSLSYDGTVRCGDVTRAVFEEVYRNEQYNISSFDFLAKDASTLLVGMWDGGVAIVDQRTPGQSSELFADLNSKTRTVHVHPVSRHYFMTAGARDVGIYDVRHLKNSGSRPVVSLSGHTKSVASAYFSPHSGNRVVTTCADNTLRVFGTSCLSSLAPILTTIRHNNNTGRWLTRFQTVWDPKRDDCFVVGSMSRPRQIQAFHATGELVHTFSSDDHLASVCSINAWHPSRSGKWILQITAGGACHVVQAALQ
ncbi:WD repeat-containing protein 76 [Varanus komodoensis]|uniref:WD repeat-containing protein 76 n=1 Tax=Varanus komodoensis TaxID=61221 RepID=UPI001CF7E78C|nr:WD repeat-containing protein 76 [Varanus komodoensis]